MSDLDDVPRRAVDNAVNAGYAELVDDLAGLLDIEAGLRELMIAARHADLVNDLSDVLDVGSGLDAILSDPLAPSGVGTDIAAPSTGIHKTEVEEYVGTEQGRLVMPFYLICDVSHSMARDMSTLNDGVRRLRQAIVSEPAVDDIAQICIMTFSDTAKIAVPLGPMSESEIPLLAAEGTTQYGKAFHALANAIEQDRGRLRKQGYRIYRPCAFFLTDGLPTDRDWLQTFMETLTYDRETGEGMKAHPIFVPFGFRDASAEVLQQLAYPPDRAKWYDARSASIDQELKGLLNIILKSVISSGFSAMTGQPTTILPVPESGSEITQHDSGYTSGN